MKKYLILAAAATVVLLGACTKKEAPYSPGAKDEGMGYYFAKEAANTTIKVAEAKIHCDVELLRSEINGAASTVITVNDTSSIFFNSKSVKVDFPDKIHKMKIGFDVEMDKLVIGKKYAIGFKIPSERSQYAPDSLTVIVDYPEPWVAYEKPGTFTDNYYFAAGPVDVTVERNGLYPNRYRIANPYKSILGESQNARADAYLNFEILKEGDVLNGVQLTKNGIIVFDEYNTGYEHPNYGEDIVWIHVSDPFLNKKSWYAECQTMEEYEYTSVIKWIDEDNLVPGVIQMDPFYMLKGLYGGWWAEADETIVITMPDYVILDTSVEVAFNSIRYDAKFKPFVAVDVNLGEDVAKAKAIVVAGNDANAALAAILAGGEDVVDVEGPELVIPMPADAATGKYSVVVATFDPDDAFAEAAFVSFNYVKAGEVPNPALFDYTAEDIVAPITKEDLLSRNWTLYGGYYDADAEDYVALDELCPITIVEVDDEAGAEEDLISVKGLSLGAGSHYGFDDSMEFEYYDGVIYSFVYEKQSFSVGGATYYINPEIGFVQGGEHYSTAEDPYVIVGGLVADNVLAFCDSGEYADYDVAYDGSVYWSLYTATGDEEEPYEWKGDLVEITNMRFVSGEDAVAPAPASPLKAIKKSFKNRTNYVETERAYLQRCIHEHMMPKNINLGTKQVIEKGKVTKKVAIDKITR